MTKDRLGGRISFLSGRVSLHLIRPCFEVIDNALDTLRFAELLKSSIKQGLEMYKS